MWCRACAEACLPSPLPCAPLQGPEARSGIFWEVGPMPSAPPISALQFSHSESLWILVKTQIVGLLPWNFWFNSLGLSRLVFPTRFQLMLVLWLSDHTLRTTAPERVALSLAALVCLGVLFPPLPSNFCVFSGVWKLLEESSWFSDLGGERYSRMLRGSWERVSAEQKWPRAGESMQ